MATQLEIINLALGKLGECFLSTYPDASKRQSDVVAAFYNISLKETLNLVPWRETFIRATYTGTAASANAGWDYLYQKGVNLASDIDHIVAVNDGQDFEVRTIYLYSNDPSIVLQYHQNTISEANMSQELVNTFALVLAKNIAPSITENQELRLSLTNELNALLPRVKYKNLTKSNMLRERTSISTPWQSARYYNSVNP